MIYNDIKPDLTLLSSHNHQLCQNELILRNKKKMSSM